MTGTNNRNLFLVRRRRRRCHGGGGHVWVVRDGGSRVQRKIYIYIYVYIL
jgi:hypothetical protein